MTLFKAIFLAGVIIVEAIRFPHRMRNKRQRRAHELGESRVGPIEIVLDLFSWVGVEILPLVYIFGRRLDFANYTLPAWAGWLGAALMAACIWLFWRAHRDLGLNWSPTLELQREHRLVTNGIYARLRHPIYAAMWVWALAQALLVWNWIAGLAGIVTFALVYATRVPKEERMMVERFGEEYTDYRQRTGALWPKMRTTRRMDEEHRPT